MQRRVQRCANAAESFCSFSLRLPYLLAYTLTGSNAKRKCVVRRVGKGALTPCPPLLFSNGGLDGGHVTRRVRVRWLCPPCGLTPGGRRHYPAFLARAFAFTSFGARFSSALAARLPAIGSSISRWPTAALRGFLPFAALAASGFDVSAGFAAIERFSASIRLITLSPETGFEAGVIFSPLRFLLINSVNAAS